MIERHCGVERNHLPHYGRKQPVHDLESEPDFICDGNLMTLLASWPSEGEEIAAMVPRIVWDSRTELE